MYEDLNITKAIFKQHQQKFEDELLKKAQEISVYQQESKAAEEKFKRTTKELDFKRVELDAVASAVKTKLDKLHKAGEKLKTQDVVYNERLNHEIAKQKFFPKLREAFRLKKKVSKNDDQFVVEKGESSSI